ncbi:hypothetical protein MMC28_009416 [Mycoblastus sanguinarius]|nr:hypothetical protein [Mycoblastus sanguinarius]
MSFGYSVGDLVLLTQLAFKVVQNSQKACGEYDELTREVTSLHTVLRRLRHEVAKPESPINRPGDTYQEDLEPMVGSCEEILRTLDAILDKYNALNEKERSGRKLWQRFRFGNGQMSDLVQLRAKLSYHASAISLTLNLISTETIGRVEKQMVEAGGDLKEIRFALNEMAAQMMSSSNQEGSVWTAYADDDITFWKELRSELARKKFTSTVLKKNRNIIIAYVKELGSRGLFDEEDPYEIHLSDAKNPDTGPESYPTSSSSTEPFNAPKTEPDANANAERMPKMSRLQKEGGLDREKARRWQEEEDIARLTQAAPRRRRSINAAENSSIYNHEVDYKRKFQDFSQTSPSLGRSDATFHYVETESLLLNSISHAYTFGYLPQCIKFISNPPLSAVSKEKQYTVLSEGIMDHILSKLDALDTEDNDAVRASKKDLARHADTVLTSLDQVEKRDEFLNSLGQRILWEKTLSESLHEMWHVYYENIAISCISSITERFEGEIWYGDLLEDIRQHSSKCLYAIEQTNKQIDLRAQDLELINDMETMTTAIGYLKNKDWRWEDISRNSGSWIPGQSIKISIDTTEGIVSRSAGPPCYYATPQGSKGKACLASHYFHESGSNYRKLP